MAAPKTTTWKLDPHTAAKHAILRRYLGAWLPILSHGGYRDIAYIDGFAGPGSYTGGEEGSPLIAIRAMASHPTPIRSNCVFHFVELDPSRAQALATNIDGLLNELGRPSNLRCCVYQEKFETAYSKIRTQLTSAGNPPTFAFIDPFGWTGMPFKIVSDLIRRPSGEVLINFMFEEINRFLAHPDQVDNFDETFGTNGWTGCVSLRGSDRNRGLRDLYAAQLNNAGAKHVRYFEMRNSRDATDYYLFFASNKLRGLEKMKEAMWKVDESGTFAFSDATDPNQTVLFAEPHFDLLKRQIVTRFSRQRASIERIKEFVLAETAFRETHIKGPVLKPMETAPSPELRVISPKPGRRVGTYPDGTVIEFLI